MSGLNHKLFKRIRINYIIEKYLYNIIIGNIIMGAYGGIPSYALMGKYQNKSSRSSYKLTKPHGSLSTKPKSLVQLAAEKIKQSIKQPSVSRKPSK